MNNTQIIYTHHQTSYHGYLVRPENISSKRPLVILAHDWSGQNDFIREKAAYIASLGYFGFALDMYGEGKTGQTTEEKQSLMMPLVDNLQLLQQVVTSALVAAKTIPDVDASRIAAIGFCFGGLCALDLARGNKEICAAASFHGLLGKPTITNYQLTAKIIAFHGYLDPMVSASDLSAFYEEMHSANIDWQIHIYGQAHHAFTNPLANDYQLGTVFNADAEKRSLTSCERFLADSFAAV